MELDKICVKEVIVSNRKLAGNGQDDPYRRVIEVFEKDGTLIAENDPLFDKSKPFFGCSIEKIKSRDEENEMPPLGIVPYQFWIEARTHALWCAILRYNEADMSCLDEWYIEIQTHLSYLKGKLTACNFHAFGFSAIYDIIFKVNNYDN